jgi:hypothetical protein
MSRYALRMLRPSIIKPVSPGDGLLKNIQPSEDINR